MHVLIQLVDVEQLIAQTKQTKLTAHSFIQETYRILTYVSGMETPAQMQQELQS